MSAIGTLDSICSGHGGFPPRPPADAEPFFQVNGIPVLVDGKQYLAHSDGDSSHDGIALTTRGWFTINGQGVVCVGDPVSCGSIVAVGDDLIDIS